MYNHHNRDSVNEVNSTDKDLKLALIADKVSHFFGSIAFLCVSASIIILYMIINSIPLIYHWDPVPFLILNTFISIFSFFTMPILLWAENAAHTIEDEERNKEFHELDDKMASLNRKINYMLDFEVALIKKVKKGPVKKNQNQNQFK
jgi:uncharacterized membrane protein